MPFWIASLDDGEPSVGSRRCLNMLPSCWLEEPPGRFGSKPAIGVRCAERRRDAMDSESHLVTRTETQFILYLGIALAKPRLRRILNCVRHVRSGGNLTRRTDEPRAHAVNDRLAPSCLQVSQTAKAHSNNNLNTQGLRRVRCGLMR